jgi:hypothetical protein
MSRQSESAPERQTLSAAQPADLGLLLASCSRRRREELGLSVERAAELTGIEISQWQALEAGWVPNLESGLREAIAETLARHGRFQVVVVWAFDRLARSVRHFLEVRDELNHIKPANLHRYCRQSQVAHSVDFRDAKGG